MSKLFEKNSKNLLDVLRLRAETQGDSIVYRFINESLEESTLTYLELDTAARKLACQIYQEHSGGDRALLLFPAGLEFLEALFACFYAKIIAVPAPVPRKNQKLGRIESIIESCTPALVMTTSNIYKQIIESSRLGSELKDKLKSIKWCLIDQLTPHQYSECSLPKIKPSTIAFLQYTSGSTAEPKGVMISHQNIFSNLQMIEDSFNLGVEHTMFSWLPMFHDLGLIGATFQPLYLGTELTFMSPESFLKDPLLWLELITRFQSKLTVAPNFAYQLCVERFNTKRARSIDLKCLNRALCGAEPIFANTLESFNECFQDNNFSLEKFYPCYGLAESSLLVSGGGKDFQGPIIKAFDSECLKQNRAKSVRLNDQTRKKTVLVACGQNAKMQQTRIVKPDERTLCKEKEIGEIWVAGPHVAKAYWRSEKISKKTFNNQLEGEEERYLKTGDLGFIDDGQMFVVGRIKDIITIHGENIAPQLIEKSVEEAHQALKKNAVAAITIREEATEKLIILAEIERQQRFNFDERGVLKKIRRAISLDHGLKASEILLLRPVSLARTSSGKIRRLKCKEQLIKNELRIIKHWKIQDKGYSKQLTSKVKAKIPLMSKHEKFTLVLKLIRSNLANILSLAAKEIHVREKITSLGLDSIQLTRIIAQIQEELNIELALKQVYKADSIAALSELIVKALEKKKTIYNDINLCQKPQPSYAQERLWLIQAIEGDSSAYTNVFTVKIRHKLNIKSFIESLNKIFDRHKVLTTTYINNKGACSVQLNSNVKLPFEYFDYSKSETKKSKKRKLKSLIEKNKSHVFDLKQAPLINITLVNIGRRHKKEFLLIVSSHHIISDAWSMHLFVSELDDIYHRIESKQKLPQTKHLLQYYDYAAWQKKALPESMMKRQEKYWKQQLKDVETLELPTKQSRANAKHKQSACYQFDIDQTLHKKIKRVAEQEGATLYMMLVAVFSILIYRYSHQRKFAIGTPVANRNPKQLESLMGFIVNTLAIKFDVDENESFISYLEALQETLIDAYCHQDVPFERVVEAVSPTRVLNQSPIFQILFVFHNLSANENKASYLKMKTNRLSSKDAKFDLLIDIEEKAKRFRCSLEYRKGLFSRSFIKQLARHYLNLISLICDDVDKKIAKHELLTDYEKEEILFSWNATCRHYDFCFLQDIIKNKSRKKVAVYYKNKKISYKELNERSTKAAYAIKKEVGREGQAIAIVTKRDENLLILIFAILKAGCCFAPIDRRQPHDKIKKIIKKSAIKCLITDEAEPFKSDDVNILKSEDLIAESNNKSKKLASKAALNLSINEHSPAYIIHTSGSTGEPKPVIISHRNICALLAWSKNTYNKDEMKAVLASTSIGFDLAMFELFAPLYNGGSVVLLESIMTLAQHNKNKQPSLINTVPSAIEVLCDQGAIPSSVKTINLAGEPLSTRLVNKLYQLPNITKVYDLYGPSEDTTYSTASLRKADEEANIGRPIDNTQCFVLDENKRAVAKGIIGELYIGGHGLTTTSNKIEQLKFIKNPFLNICQYSSELLYKTGDIVKYNEVGKLIYLGREDNQIKLRGFRLELNEIKSCIESTNLTKCVALKVHKTNSKQVILCAYIVAKDKVDNTINLVEAIKQHLSQNLASYMHPGRYEILERLPLLTSGKVNYKALKHNINSDTSDSTIKPKTELEAELLKIWRCVLKLEQLSVTDDFFEIGGNSLLVMRLIYDIEKVLSIKLPMRVIFSHPRIIEQAKFIDENCIKKKISANTYMDVKENSCSMIQQGLWFIQHYAPNNSMYNMPFIIKMNGALDLMALNKALDLIFDVHQELRACFNLKGKKIEKTVIKALSNKTYDFIKLESSNTNLNEILNHMASQAFDLSGKKKGDLYPAIRLKLIQITEKKTILAICAHHIVADGWSIEVFLSALQKYYSNVIAGKNISIKKPESYQLFSTWQKKYLESKRSTKDKNFWKKTIGKIEEVNLFKDEKSSNTSKHFHAKFSSATNQAIKQFTIDNKSSAYECVLAAYLIYISLEAKQKKVSIVSPYANRLRGRWQETIGPFVNMLAIGLKIKEGHCYIDVVNKLRKTILEGYDHADYPFDQIVRDCNIKRKNGRHPLFKLAFIWSEQNKLNDIKLGNMTCNFERLYNNNTKFDLSLDVTHCNDVYELCFEYEKSLYTAKSIKTFVNNYETLFKEILNNKSTALSKLLRKKEETAISYRHKNFLQYFHQAVSKHKNKIALRFDGKKVTYQQLDVLSSKLAYKLKEKGIGAGSIIPIISKPCEQLIISILALWKIGAAYTAIDINSPIDRKEFILNDIKEDNKKRFILCDKSSANELENLKKNHRYYIVSELFNQLGKTNNTIKYDALDKRYESLPAYLIYTSGSTGHAKGVLLSHKQLAAQLADSFTHYNFLANDIWVLFHSLSFDFSVWEYCGALASGGRLVIAPQSTRMDLSKFYDLVSKERVSVLNITPSVFSYFDQLDQDQKKKLSLKKIIFGGDKLVGKQIKPWLERHQLEKIAMFNMYGITEACIHATYYQIKKKDTDTTISTIGKALPSLRSKIINKNGKVKNYGYGELILAGAAVINAYYNNKALDEDKFIKVSNKKKSRPYYKTGDIVTINKNNTIVYHHRIDSQIQLRGYRVEPGEIEKTIEKLKNVGKVIVAVEKENDINKYLVAYICPEANKSVNLDAVKEELNKKLERHMLPNRVVLVNEVPINNNGKIDVVKLKEINQLLPDKSYKEKPQNDVEHWLHYNFVELLEIDDASIDDDFFELGGHSLLLTQLHVRINNHYGSDLSLQELYNNATIRKIADLIILSKASKFSEEKLLSLIDEVEDLS